MHLIFDDGRRNSVAAIRLNAEKHTQNAFSKPRTIHAIDRRIS
jgi:hypothetical protein